MLELELSDKYPVVDHVNELGQSSAIAAIIELLPLGSLLALLAVIGVIFAATTMIQLHIPWQLAPANNLKLKDPKEHSGYWAIFLGLLPSAFSSVGLKQ